MYLYKTDLILVVDCDKKEQRLALRFRYEIIYLFDLDDFCGRIADFYPLIDY